MFVHSALFLKVFKDKLTFSFDITCHFWIKNFQLLIYLSTIPMVLIHLCYGEFEEFVDIDVIPDNIVTHHINGTSLFWITTRYHVLAVILNQ